MPDMDREKVKVPCPACGKDIEVQYRELWGGSRKIKCRCRAEIQYDSSLASQARREADDLERARRDFEKSFEKMIREKVQISQK